MNDEQRKEEEQRAAGFTTVAPANASEHTALTEVVEAPPLGTTLPRQVRPGSAPTLSGDSVAPAGTATQVGIGEQVTPLFSADEAREFRGRWDAIQAGFVDEPRRAVERADSLVAETMKRLAEIFTDERAKLDAQWGRDESVSTEHLRLALRRYRSFFGRLLSL